MTHDNDNYMVPVNNLFYIKCIIKRSISQLKKKAFLQYDAHMIFET